LRHVGSVEIALLLALLAASPALAEGDPEAKPREPRRAAEILATLDQPEADEGWLNFHLDRVRVGGEGGLQYRQSFPGRERNTELRVRGPALKRKTVGLEIEFRF
jgi:hypothetical protein